MYQALKETGFEKYVEQLKDFMANYNADKEDQAPKLTYKKRTNAEMTTPAGNNGGRKGSQQDDEEMENGMMGASIGQ